MPPGEGPNSGITITGDRNVAAYQIVNSQVHTGDNIFLGHLTDCATARELDPLIEELVETGVAKSPFGGRTRELSRLDEWLEHGSRYLLLYANAGYGKSSLLFHWVRSLRDQRPALDVIYIPISIRGETNYPEDVFPHLCRKLAIRLGKESPEPSSLRAAKHWEVRAAELLREVCVAKRRLLLVIDGLDEMAGWIPSSTLFPKTRSELRVLASARTGPEDSNGSVWLRALGWTVPGLADTLSLGKLTQKDVCDAVAEMGCPAELLQTIHRRLYELSDQGDPLVLGLYLAKLSEGEAGWTINLDSLDPGLDGFFERFWWHEQMQLWGEKTPDRRHFGWTLLSYLACAFGPLSRDDLRKLVGDALPGRSFWESDLAPLRRLVVVNRDGEYSFAHPRLRDYYHKQRMDPEEQAPIEQRFREWGRATLASLGDGTGSTAEDVTRYALRFYGRHLQRHWDLESARVADVDHLVPHAEAFGSLLGNGWRRAWYWQERGYAGFLEDVDRAWNVAEEVDRRLLTSGREARFVGLELRCALYHGSVCGLSGTIPPNVVLAAAKAKLLSPSQSIALALAMPPATRLQTLRGLQEMGLPPEQQLEAIAVSLKAMAEVKDESQRSRVLCFLASCMPESLLLDALGVVESLQSEHLQVRVFLAFVSALPNKLAGRAFTHVRRVQFDDLRAAGLVQLAPVLPPDLVADAVRSAIEIHDDVCRAWALGALLPRLPAEARPEALDAALRCTYVPEDEDLLTAITHVGPVVPPEAMEQVTRLIPLLGTDDAKVMALKAIVHRLPAERWPEVVDYVEGFLNKHKQVRAFEVIAPHVPRELVSFLFDVVEAGENEGIKVEELAAIANLLPDDMIDRAWAVARSVPTEEWCSRAVKALAPRLREEIWEDALGVICKFKNVHTRASTLSTVSHWAPPALADKMREARKGLPGEYPEVESPQAHIPRLPAASVSVAWRRLRLVRDPQEWADRMEVLAPQLPAELWGEVLDSVEQVNQESGRAQGLLAVAAHMPDSLIPRAWAILKGLREQVWRSRAIAKLAARFPASLWDEVFRSIEQVSDLSSEALVAICRYLPAELHGRALEVVRNLEDESSRGRALRELAGRVGRGLWPSLLADILALRNIYDRASLLESVAPAVPKELLGEVLRVCDPTQNESTALKVLFAITSKLPADLVSVAFDLGRRAEDEYWRVQLVRVFIPAVVRSNPAMLAGLLSEIERIYRASERLDLLSALEPHLDEDLTHQALGIALRTADQRDKPRILAQLLDRLPAIEKERAFPAIEEWVHSLDPREWDNFLDILIPALPVGRLPDILEFIVRCDYQKGQETALAALANVAEMATCLRVRVYQYGRQAREYILRTRALVGSVQHLQGADLQEAARSALDPLRHPHGQKVQADIVSVLARLVPSELLSRLLEYALRLEDEHSCSRALWLLLPRLQGSAVHDGAANRALQAGGRILSPFSRAEMLCRLIPNLPASGLPGVLDVIGTLPDRFLRAKVLAALGLRLAEPVFEAALLLPVGPDQARILASLIPGLAASRKREAIRLACSAVAGGRDIDASAAVALLPCLGDAERVELMRETLRRLQPRLEPAATTAALECLAPHLTVDLWLVALDLVAQFNNDAYKRAAFGKIVAHLEGEQLARAAFEVLLSIEDSDARAVALAMLAPRLPGDVIARVWSEVPAIQDERHRADMYCGLATQLPAEVLAEGLELGLAFRDRWHRERALSALAPRLEPELLNRALEQSQRVGDHEQCERALVGLIGEIDDSRLLLAVECLRYIRSAERQMGAIEQIMPRLDAVLSERALLLGWQHGEGPLRRLIPRISDLGLGVAVRYLDRIENEDWRAETLEKLLPRLTEVLVAEVFPFIERLGQSGKDKWLSRLLVQGAARLPRGLVTSAARLALSIGAGEPRVDALVALLPRLSANSLRMVIDALAGLSSSLQAQLLGALVAVAEGSTLTEAVARAYQLDAEDQVEVLRAFAPRLTGRMRPVLLRWVEALLRLEAPQFNQSATFRLLENDRLAELASSLSKIPVANHAYILRWLGRTFWRELFLGVLALIAPRFAFRERWVAQGLVFVLLSAIAPRLSVDLLLLYRDRAAVLLDLPTSQWVLALVSALYSRQEARGRIRALASIVDEEARSRITELYAEVRCQDCLGSLVELSEKLENCDERARLLMTLVRHAAEKDLPRLVNVARDQLDSYSAERAIQTCQQRMEKSRPRVAPPSEAADTAPVATPRPKRALPAVIARTLVGKEAELLHELSNLAEGVEQYDPESLLHDLFRQFLRELALTSRAKTIEQLPRWAAVLRRLDPRNGVADACKAIAETAQWWP
jgi:hypothetical protein